MSANKPTTPLCSGGKRIQPTDWRVHEFEGAPTLNTVALAGPEWPNISYIQLLLTSPHSGAPPLTQLAQPGILQDHGSDDGHSAASSGRADGSARTDGDDPARLSTIPEGSEASGPPDLHACARVVDEATEGIPEGPSEAELAALMSELAQ